jgi:hypothetical protein
MEFGDDCLELSIGVFDWKKAFRQNPDYLDEFLKDQGLDEARVLGA